MLSLRLRALSDWASDLSNAYRWWLHRWRRAESIENQWLWFGGKQSLFRFTNVLCQTTSALTQATCTLRRKNLTTEVSLWLTTIVYQIFSFHTMLLEFENAEIYNSVDGSSIFVVCCLCITGKMSGSWDVKAVSVRIISRGERAFTVSAFQTNVWKLCLLGWAYKFIKMAPDLTELGLTEGHPIRTCGKLRDCAPKLR